MVISYASWILVTNLAVSGSTAAAKKDSKFDVIKALAALLGLPPADVTDWSSSPPAEKVTSSMATNQEPLLLQIVKTERGPVPREQNPHFGNFETKFGSSQICT